MIHLLEFRSCVVRLWRPDFMDTYFFEDGGVVPALFVDDAQARATAAACGYTTTAALHRDHDVAHTFLAEARGLPYSPVLRHVAGGVDVPREARAQEEGEVLAFQTYVNTGAYSPLLDVFPDVKRLAAEFRIVRDAFEPVEHVYCELCGACLVCDAEEACADEAPHVWPRRRAVA